MNRLQLNATAVARLEAQLRLSGIFQHRLDAEQPRRSVHTTIAVEQASKAIRVEVAHNGTRNSVTLDKKRRDNVVRIARFIEATVNGDAVTGPPEMDGDVLVSDLEIALREALRFGQGTFVLPADELEPKLLISRTSRGGFLVQLRLGSANAGFTLPADRSVAHTRLTAHLQRFLQDYRAAFSAVA